MVDANSTEIGDTLHNLNQNGSRIDYEVVNVEEQQTFGGTEVVITVTGDTTGETDIYAKDHDNWEKVE